ncbi:hypothetical protein EG329_002479 [Mollisiaceae sp. DMI_Dod_QoI]|nr:hypothetical protein EG329_002479 [Helotiales sp. DMI_Dod_QoI]
MADFFKSSILYLDRLEKYKQEKPYEIILDISDPAFATGPEAAQTNMEDSPHEVTIQNARRKKDDFKIGIHGFQFAHFPSSLRDKDFDNLKLVESVYYTEVQDLVKSLFGKPMQIFIVNHQRRKRNAGITENVDIPYRQPVPTAHADYSPNGAKACVAELLKSNPELSGQYIEMIKQVAPPGPLPAR